MKMIPKNIFKIIRSYLPKNSEILFDRKFYLENYIDIADAGVDPYLHFLKHGIRENRSPNALFNIAYYASQLSSLPTDPTLHYLQRGAKLGLNPHPQFDTRWYMENYKDVAESGMNPLVHYLRYGRRENRQTAPHYMKIFGSIMPHALGLKMFDELASATFSVRPAQSMANARYFRQIMMPFRLTAEERASVLVAGKIVSNKNIPEVEVTFRGGGISTNLCIVFYGCVLAGEEHSKIEILFQEAHVFLIDNGNLAFSNGLSSGLISLSSR